MWVSFLVQNSFIARESQKRRDLPGIQRVRSWVHLDTLKVDHLIPRLMHLSSWVNTTRLLETSDCSAYSSTTQGFQVSWTPGVRASDHLVCTLHLSGALWWTIITISDNNLFTIHHEEKEPTFFDVWPSTLGTKKWGHMHAFVSRSPKKIYYLKIFSTLACWHFTLRNVCVFFLSEGQPSIFLLLESEPVIYSSSIHWVASVRKAPNQTLRGLQR